jgi:hypothetical protein
MHTLIMLLLRLRYTTYETTTASQSLILLLQPRTIWVIPIRSVHRFMYYPDHGSQLTLTTGYQIR